jgi:hypothetical protein
MSPDYLPTADSEFTAWLKNFVDYAGANTAALGLTPAEVTLLTSARTNWEAAFLANIAAQGNAQATRQTKDASRTAAQDLIRPLVQRIQTTGTVQDANREGLGITVRSTSRTPSPTPESRPVVTVDTAQRLRHIITFVDENTPNSRAKPGGVSGCEVWVKVDGPPPVDPVECHYLATDTRAPYTADYDGADAGKVAHYMLRWVNTRGETGPWSQTVSATITA